MTPAEASIVEPGAGNASAVLGQLQLDHARLNQVLGVVARHIESTDTLIPEGDQPYRHALAGMLSFLHEYADRVHHPLENRLFDRLIEKGLTPSERRVVFVTMSQHEEILADVRSLRDALCAPHGGAVEKSEVERYLQVQRRHLDFEDTQLLPLIYGRLTERDWRDMEPELSAQMQALQQVCDTELLAAFLAIVEAA